MTPAIPRGAYRSADHSLRMPPSDTEPENYSIDDMMDRLRSRGEGGSEGDAQLVTREDGTQVYRVKKRKRRSHQPKKEKEQRQKRFRVLQVVLAVGLVILVAAAFFASLVILNSSAYRDSILAKVRSSTGAEPKISGLRVTPVSANADSLELVWPEDSMLESLRMGAIDCGLTFTKLLGGKWQGSEMYSAQGGTLVLKPFNGKVPQITKSQTELPFRFGYRASKFNVRMGDEKLPAFAVKGSEASWEVHDAFASSSNLQLEGGTLTVAGWGEFRLNLASLQFEPQGMRIGNIQIVPSGAEKGEIKITNPKELPLKIEGEDAQLRVEVSNIALKDLLGPTFGTWLSTTVETVEGGEPGQLRTNTLDQRGVSWRIPFRAIAAASSEAEGLPMFEVLAEEMKENWYLKPHFDVEAKGVAIRDGTFSAVEDLALQARGRLGIEGKIKASATGILEGEFQVGLPTSAVSGGSPALRAVFNRRGGEFSWAKVRISGTTAKPADDLQVQLKSATTTVAPASGGANALENTFDDLIAPGGK